MCSEKYLNSVVKKVLLNNTHLRVMTCDIWLKLDDEQQEWVRECFLEFPGTPPLAHFFNIANYALHDYEYVTPPEESHLNVFRSHEELAHVFAPPSWMKRNMLPQYEAPQ